MSAQPIVSIITVVYNGEQFLERTIKSVLEQSYPNIEYIVVDGASKDGALEIVRKYEDRIARWVSEPDKGIYDAMNKGMKLATGDYYWFMNAGDVVYDPETLSLAMELAPGAQIIYGDTLMLNEDYTEEGMREYKKLPEHLTVDDMRLGMVVCHQSIIAHKDVAPEYDLAHHFSGDIDWTIRALKQADPEKVVNTGLILSRFLKGGFSKQRHRASLTDRFNILRKHFGLFGALGAHVKIFWQALRRKLIPHA